MCTSRIVQVDTRLLTVSDVDSRWVDQPRPVEFWVELSVVAF